MKAIGYIRQSRRADLDVALSYDAQLAAIRRMAGGDVEILSDMGRSGKAGGEYLRPGYLSLLDRVRSKSVDAVYVLSLSRLSRSVPELHDFMDLAQSTGCAIVAEKEGKLDPTTATGKLMVNIFSSFAEYVRDLQVEAAQENVALRRSRGERMGRVPYGERPGDAPEAVAVAFEEAGRSLNGAALRLNQMHIPSAMGCQWSGPAVRLVLERVAPGLLPAKTTHGVKPSSPFLLFRLLRCACGRTLTASRDGRGNRDVVYRCHEADANPGHHRPYRVRESVLLPWVKAEAARFDPHRQGSVLERAAADDQERAKLGADRAYIVDIAITAKLDKAELARRLAVVDAALASLDERRDLKNIPPGIDWTWPAERINTVLRTYWSAVRLDVGMQPVAADWKLPAEWLR